MKRLSLLLVIFLILNFIVVGNVFADNICKISAGFNPSNPNPWKELKITISAKDITEGISAVSFTLDYDSSVFDLTGVEKKDGWTISQTESLFSIITDDYNATTKAGDIGAIKLKVKDNAKVGTTTIKLTSIEAAKEDASIISIGEISQDITIKNVNIEPSKDTNTTDKQNTVNTTNTVAEPKKNNTKTNNTTKTDSKNSNTKNTNTVTNKDTDQTESKNMVLPKTGNVVKGVGIVGILAIVSIFSIISLRVYFKYKNI